MKIKSTYRGNPLQLKEFNVYLVCGQSNCVGTYNLDGNPTNDTVHDDQINIWDSSGTAGSLANVSGGWRTFRTWLGGFGPERGMARALTAAGVPNVAIIKWARNGSSIASWVKTAGIYYPELTSDVTKAFDSLKPRGTPVFRGFLWMQGESDSDTQLHADAYGPSLTSLVSDLRADTAYGSAPLVVVRTHSWLAGAAAIATVRAAQMQIGGASAGWVDSDDTPPREDNVHMMAKGKEIVGERAAPLFLATL